MSDSASPAPSSKCHWIESEIADDQFEVKVTIVVGLQFRGEYPGVRDSIDTVLAALMSRDKIPNGSRIYEWGARVHDAKSLRRRARKLAKEQPHV